jgi:hypothetical protein
VHLVDLDAAFGRGSNRELITEVVARLDIAVELSGGIRDETSLQCGPGHWLCPNQHRHRRLGESGVGARRLSSTVSLDSSTGDLARPSAG